MKLNIQGTPVLNELLRSKRRFVLSVGSSRSSKTFSMLQWIVIECLKRSNQGIYISVVRASFPSLRRTVYREFVDLLKSLNMYSDDKHNKTEHVIEVAGNYVEFFSLSDSQKVRGAKRNYLYLNECNEIDYESAQQLFLRTEERIFMDQNPSDAWHWSFKMKDRDDVDYIHSTYKMNPFLTRATVNQIESYKDTDENFWRIYGLGLPGFATTTIYSHWKEYKERDTKVYNEEGAEQPFYDSFCYGLDVAYSSIMALIRVYIKDDTIWWEEVIYQSGLTSYDLIRLMNDLGIEKDKDIWCDAAAPNVIEDLKRAGYNAKSADKDVKAGIDLIKSKKLFINTESTNLISEIRRYQWKTKNEEIIYEPVKVNDHLMDGGRYATFNYFKITKRYEDNDIDFEFLDL
jgi:phage terminase large subunit